MISFDTNILIYSVAPDAGARHQASAVLVERVIRSNNCVQPLQTLAEFFNVATRRMAMEPNRAALFVDDWRTVVRVEPASFSDLKDAMRAVRQHGLSFWDAMLWATVRRAGVRVLVSEDFQDGRTIEGVRIVNPFAAHNAALLDRELRAGPAPNAQR